MHFHIKLCSWIGFAVAGIILPIAQADSDTVLATVNGKSITQAMYDSYSRQVTVGKMHVQEAVPAKFEGLITAELMIQDALAKGIDERPEIKKQIDDYRNKIYMEALLKNHVKDTVNAQAKADNPTAAQAEQARAAQEYLNRFKLADGGTGLDTQAIAREVMAKGLDKEAEVADQLTKQYRLVLTTATNDNYMMEQPVTDAEIKKAYEASKNELGLQEANVTYFLAPTLAQANDIIARLDKDENFDKLVRELQKKAKEEGETAVQVGHIEWLNPYLNGAPFGNAVAALKEGEYTKEPVKLGLGPRAAKYHPALPHYVIKMHGRRDAPPPPLDDVKDKLRTDLQVTRGYQYVDVLRNKAKIEILSEPKDEPLAHK